MSLDNVKTSYQEGESFDKTNLKVYAVYDDESEVEVNDYIVSPSGPLSLINTFVTISYQGFSKSIPITVSKKVITLVSIEIDYSNVKTSYKEGESFDKTNLIVKAVYSDGSNQVITDYTIAPTGPLSLNDTNVTISYEGKTKQIPIPVSKKEESQNMLPIIIGSACGVLAALVGIITPIGVSKKKKKSKKRH